MAGTMRGTTAIVGLAETTYYKRGGAEDAEFKLGLMAVRAAAEDAGIDVRDIDGFCSYSNDRNDPTRFHTALGLHDLKWASMVWGGGGGGCAGAVAMAAAAVHAGIATNVVVFRALAQGQFGRFGAASQTGALQGAAAYTQPYGQMSPAQSYAMKVTRFMHDHGVEQSALRAVSLASYYHAQRNPRAVMYGRPLDEEKYDNSRWIVEPFHLYDCCQENDGAAAVIVTTAERARDMKNKPVYILAGGQGSQHRQSAWAHNAPDYGTSNFKNNAKSMFDMAQVKPEEVDVAQVYENFTGGVVMSIIEHGLIPVERANEEFTLDNFRFDGGKLPLNTSGGNLAECYMHGFELITEAARQIRGESTAQVDSPEISLVAGGPMVEPTSNLLLGAQV
ncbi:MAG: acetyl-CoA acetyltransferase [Chloroflexi bacterium]|nr:acetyl-CoA acetyltransferase [Chloroflexota bacterium]MYE31173.1 acetyl-CoA acetyltransferase [Chloroflexota bacterium]